MALRSLTFATRNFQKCINQAIAHNFQNHSLSVVACQKHVDKHNNLAISKQPQRQVNALTLELGFGKWLRKFQFYMTGRKYKKYILKRSSLRMYVCTVELINHDQIIKKLNLPDTISSWFRITELHMWMLLSRLSLEGKDGHVCRNAVMEYMWRDVEKKFKKLGQEAAYTSRRDGMTHLGEQFRAAMFSYDEGMLRDDKALAAAVWRNLFEKNCTAADLEFVVEYIHKQMSHLHRMQSDQILFKGIVKPLPMLDGLSTKNDQVLSDIIKQFQ